MSRDRALTIPAVTVAWKPNGEPIAIAQSPTCSASELPIFAAGKILLVDMNDRQIGFLVDADHLGRILGGIAHELDLDARRFFHDVIVGQDVAVLVDHHAGSESLRCGLPAADRGTGIRRHHPPPKKRWKNCCIPPLSSSC